MSRHRDNACLKTTTPLPPSKKPPTVIFGDPSMVGSGGTGGTIGNTVMAEIKRQQWLELIAEFWNHYQHALPVIKIDITADDVKQMLLLAEIAKIATEYEDGQP